MGLSFLCVFISTSFLAAVVYISCLHCSKGTQYPPGPARSFIGNLTDIPSKLPWITFTKWGKQYGPLVYLRVPGKHFIIINSSKLANELLQKRSQVYSDRAFSNVLESAGWGFSLPAMPYSDEWQINRRLHHRSLNTRSMPRFWPTLERNVHQFLQSLINEPSYFMDHIEVLTGGSVLATMFGLNVTSTHSQALQCSKTAINSLEKVMGLPFIFVATYLPFYRYLPSSFPVLGQFKRNLHAGLNSLRAMRELVVDHVERLVQEGDTKSSLVAELIKSNREIGGSIEDENRIVNMGLITYAAGADNMVSSLCTFFLAMVRNPHCQENAQAEINAVTGGNRLPTFSDRPSMPYIEAIYREVLRWHPPMLLAPHATTKDDDYNGYLIPKGSIALANIWSMTHDEDKYKKPHDFNPNRYFENGKLNDDRADILAFGFGRRICVGRYFSEALLWLAIASTLAVFRIEKAKSEKGEEIDTPESYSTGAGLSSHPLPFQCSIVPRSGKVKALVGEASSS
ncbi:putative CyP450 monooxygenase [Marasmius fiardii PR-910]|nr:putative CyP450 monooxygenase [Marasmius fiardii PR-910]